MNPGIVLSGAFRTPGNATRRHAGKVTCPCYLSGRAKEKSGLDLKRIYFLGGDLSC